MANRPVEILLVEDDVALAEMIEACLRDALSCHLTHVTSVADALREELTTSHDVIVTSTTLPDGDGLRLIQELRATKRGPVVLMTEDPTVEEAIAAVRLRVTDLLIKPFDLAELAAAVRTASDGERRRRRHRRRYRRLQRVAARIVCERRDLRQRMDLICQDLVHAYRRLAQKVTDSGVISHAVDD